MNPVDDSGHMWFDAFRKNMNVLFTEEDYEAYSEVVKGELPAYERYLMRGARLLDVGCGLGCTSIPLSNEGFEIVGIDNDERVIEAARRNGRRFGGKIEFLLMDAFEIEERFGKDSFDACIHGGFLEHFPRREIEILIRKQLAVAPLVICSVPVRTPRTLRHYRVEKKGNRKACSDGIDRNLWTAKQWTNQVLRDRKIVESKVSGSASAIGDFDELQLVIRRC